MPAPGKENPGTAGGGTGLKELQDECITRTLNCGQGFNNRADHWTDGSGHSKNRPAAC
jgi:hypothetical protein